MPPLHPARFVAVVLDEQEVELALQAVDGTKVGTSASRDCTLDAEGLRRRLARTQAAIGEL